MLIRHTLRLGIVGVLLAPYALVIAQGVSGQELSTPDLVKGNYGKFATRLRIEELPTDYAAIKITGASSPSELGNPMMSVLMVGVRGGSPELSLKAKLADVSWTNGDIVRALNKDFLVTYKLDFDLASLMPNVIGSVAEMSTGPDTYSPPGLKITLVALDSIQCVTPCPELTKETLAKTFNHAGPVRGAWGIAPAMSQRGQTVAVSNLKQISLGLMMYSNDYDDYMPYAQSTKAVQFVIYPYIKNKAVWKDPNPRGGEIRFNMGVSGVLMPTIPDPAETVLVFESEPWPDGRRAVGFCDGHVKLVNPQDWSRLWAKAKPAGLRRGKKPLPANYGENFKIDTPRTTTSDVPDVAPASAVPSPASVTRKG